jgi:predicted nucleotidyltransferase
MPSELEQILAALGDARVRYLVVGGVAVVLHGYLRVTADLDLVIELETTNVRRAVAAFERLGFRPRAPVALAEFADAEIREGWIREKGLTVFSLWSPELPGFEVDLFVREPFDFGEVHARAVRVELATCTATVISLADLIVLKQQAGRSRDQEDVAALQALGERHDDEG